MAARHIGETEHGAVKIRAPLHVPDKYDDAVQRRERRTPVLAATV
jgi:hypothetical protein